MIIMRLGKWKGWDRNKGEEIDRFGEKREYYGWWKSGGGYMMERGYGIRMGERI